MNTIELRKNECAAELALAILKRAVDDYNDLLIHKIESCSTSHEGKYSKREIEEFFEGDFCKFIAQELDKRAKPRFDASYELFELLKGKQII